MIEIIITGLPTVTAITLAFAYTNLKFKNRKQAQIITEQVDKIKDLREAVKLEREIRKSMPLK